MKFDGLHANIGGHDCLIHGEVEFKDDLPPDTIAGALLVEDRRNAAFVDALAHTEQDGAISVTYDPMTAARIETEVAEAPTPAPKPAPKTKAKPKGK